MYLKAFALGIVIGLTHALALGQHSVDWHTIDGGGGVSSGGDLILAGTIGQHDAGSPAAPLTGGGFTIVGGFWQMAAPSCACPGDTNEDGIKNAADIQSLVNCMLFGGTCWCAELDGVSGLSASDVDMFVSDLLSGAACP